MTKTLATALFAILAGLLLLRPSQPHSAEAAVRAPAHVALTSLGADVSWPAPQEPFETTPITPVESTGAPMYGND